jgi:uncharacterized small protein (DUF1192 family)
MVADDDETEQNPRTRRGTKLQPLVLDSLGLAELNDYIVELKAEIVRVEAAMAKKQDHRGVADAFFRKA